MAEKPGRRHRGQQTRSTSPATGHGHRDPPTGGVSTTQQSFCGVLAKNAHPRATPDETLDKPKLRDSLYEIADENFPEQGKNKQAFWTGGNQESRLKQCGAQWGPGAERAQVEKPVTSEQGVWLYGAPSQGLLTALWSCRLRTCR